MRVRTTLLATLLVFAFSVSTLHAQYVEMYRLDQRAKDLSEEHALNALSTHLGVSVDSLKQQRAEYKSSVGELYLVNQFAKLSKADFKTIMADYKSGKAWSEIAKARQIQMDDVAKDARRLEDAFKAQRSSR